MRTPPTSALFSVNRQLLVGFSVLLLASCSKTETPQEVQVPVRTVLVGSVAEPLASESIPIYAAVVASRFASELAFRVPGRILTRGVEMGDQVKAGGSLATLDPEPFRIAVRSAQALVAASRAELIQAEGDLARNAPLVAERIVAPAQADRLLAQRDTARARLAQAQAQEAAAQDDLGHTTLRSPAKGVVTQVSAEVGQYVAPGQPVFRVARPDNLDAVVDVPESAVAAIRPDMPATVLLVSTQQPIAGRIREVSPIADPATRTYRVKVALATSSAARIGMSASVRFAGASDSAKSDEKDGEVFSLPLSAITQSGERPAVWVVKGESVLELRQVTLGSYRDNNVTITAGIQRGERVVTAGVNRLDAQQTVKLWDGQLP